MDNYPVSPIFPFLAFLSQQAQITCSLSLRKLSSFRIIVFYFIKSQKKKIKFLSKNENICLDETFFVCNIKSVYEIKFSFQFPASTLFRQHPPLQFPGFKTNGFGYYQKGLLRELTLSLHLLLFIPPKANNFPSTIEVYVTLRVTTVFQKHFENNPIIVIYRKFN